YRKRLRRAERRERRERIGLGVDLEILAEIPADALEHCRLVVDEKHAPVHAAPACRAAASSISRSHPSTRCSQPAAASAARASALARSSCTAASAFAAYTASAGEKPPAAACSGS